MSFWKSIFKAAVKVAATAVGFAVGGPAGAAIAASATGYVQGDRGLSLALDAVGGYYGGSTAYNLGSGAVNSASLAAGGAGGYGTGATLSSIGSGVSSAVSSGLKSGSLSSALSGAGDALSGTVAGSSLPLSGSVNTALNRLAGTVGVGNVMTAPAAGGLSSLLGGGNALSTLSSLYSGIQGTQAAKDIAKAQMDANNKAIALQSKMYNQTTANMNPFLTSGQSANQRLYDLLGISGNAGAEGYGSLTKQFAPGDLTQDPGYQFRLAQGTKSMNQTLGAQGNLFSGEALKAAQDFGQGLADQTYNDAYTRYVQDQNNAYSKLAGTSGAGQSAAANQGATNAAYGQNVGTLYGNAGDIYGNKTMASNNAQNQALSGIINGTYGFTGGGLSSYANGVDPNVGKVYKGIDAMGRPIYA